MAHAIGEDTRGDLITQDALLHPSPVVRPESLGRVISHFTYWQIRWYGFDAKASR